MKFLGASELTVFVNKNRSHWQEIQFEEIAHKSGYLLCITISYTVPDLMVRY